MNKLILPLPPSYNHAYLTTRQGKRIMTNECRDWKEYARLSVLKQIGHKPPAEAILIIQYNFYFADNRRRDVPDNYSKVLRDILKDTIVKDDCWQCIGQEHFGPHGIDKDNPRVEIIW